MERRFWLKTFALGLLAIAALAVGSSLYLGQVQQSIRSLSIENVMQVTEEGAKAFEVYLEQGETTIQGRAASFEDIDSSDASAIERELDIYDQGDPLFVVIDLTHRVLYFNSDKKIEISRDQAKRYLDLPQKGFLEPFLSEHNGRRVLGYYERFKFADGAQGMVQKTVPVTEVTSQFSLSFYDDAGFTYVVNRQGDILLRSAGEHGNRTLSNIFDVIKLDNSGEDDAKAFIEAMAEGKRGIMHLNFNGEDHLFAFVPINATDGWYLVSVVPDSVIMKEAENLLQSSQIFVAVIVAAALIFFLFVLVVARHRRKIKAQEAEVVYREQLFNTLTRTTNDVFAMLSHDGKRVRYISPNVERVMGISQKDALQDPARLQDVLHNGGQKIQLEEALAIPLGESISFECGSIHPVTGDRRWFTETFYHIEVQGIDRFIVVIADTTEARQKEAALTEALQIAKVANESKSSFLSNMSHDIRTPMNAIVGLTTLLQRDADNPDRVRQHTHKITASSQHLLGLINDVLDMSKIESGKTSLNIGEFNLAELIDELNTIMRPQAASKQQTFDVVVRDIRDEYLLGDKLRINQVMINILSNAVKYTAEGGHIVLAVQQMGQVTQNIARIRFTVADNGMGMSDEYQELIFQPFTREMNSVVNQIQGTGLGMAITKSLVDLMGGTISVKSKLGEGTTFTLDLDLRIAAQEDDLDFWENHGIRHALVVDDEEEVCTEIMTAMGGTGVNMEFALDGQTAVNMTASARTAGNDFDLILLDWKMPGMNGLETARKIRETVPEHIPIMIITAYDYEEIRDESLAVGIDGFLSKPFFLSNFKEAIRAIALSDILHEEPAPRHDLKGRHFLYAEDNDLNAFILSDLLDMEGATCDRFINGKEAVKGFAAAPVGKYDAILMDVQMPVMNGYEAARAIRDLDDPEAKTIPIVALTANAFADDVQDALNAGMNAHVAKPVDMQKLIEALTPLWEQKDQEG